MLDLGGKRTGIEVTSSSRVRADKIERVRKTGKALGTEQLLLVYGGLVNEAAEGIRALPLSRFLLNPSACLMEEP